MAGEGPVAVYLALPRPSFPRRCRSIRGDEAEEAWRVLTPVLEGWPRERFALPEKRGGLFGGNTK
jgi:glucose-6-phosphate 1-dehydrogenase